MRARSTALSLSAWQPSRTLSTCAPCLKSHKAAAATAIADSRPKTSSNKHSSQPTRSKEPRFNYVSNPFDATPDPDSEQYKVVTARELVNRKTPPRRVKMLARDFIDDCLYNPHYGYFSTQAVIFDPDQTRPTVTNGRQQQQRQRQQIDSVASRAEGFDFQRMRNSTEFEFEIARRYGEFEGTTAGVGTGPGRQVWHTPTELFKPWYGRAIARFLVAEYKLNLYPYEDLVIYEIGAGNGTLMGDILDYIAEEEPEVYERTQYRIVEISERLQGLQRGRAMGGDGKAALKGPARRKHADKVEVMGGSIFDWDRVVPEPCFFLAMEVLDNFAHDVIRYSTLDHEPYQCVVSVDSTGDYTELYEPVSDPLIARYLQLRSRLPSARQRSPLLNPLMSMSPLLRKIYAAIPFAPNLTAPEFLPTKQLMLLDILRDKFPYHRILFSDFSSLPDAVPGINAPVVQTRYEGETVACTTYLVQPGFFDIFFPTDFHLLRDMYSLVMSSPQGSVSASGSTLDSASTTTSPPPISASASPRIGADFFSSLHASRRARGGPSSSNATNSSSGLNESRSSGMVGPRGGLRVLDHAEFLERWGEVDMTRVRDGSNPMLDSYRNAAFIL